MRVLLIARKSLVEILREVQLLALVLLLPVVFLGITAASYTAPLLATHPLLVINTTAQGASLIETLQEQRYADGRPIFNITPVADRKTAEIALNEHTATALVIIEADDSGESDFPFQVTIEGDALYTRFYRASIILDSVIARYTDRVSGRPEMVQTVGQSLAKNGPQNEFDVYAPGIIIFALLMLIPQTAMLVAREIRWKTLRRLRLTPIRAWDLLGGMGLAQMAVAVVQVVLVFLAALVMGFHNRGSLGLAIAVGLVVSFSAIGQGLVVACFSENDSQAANLGGTAAMLQVFLSGSFYQLPSLTMFTLAGHQIDLFDIFPATHGFLALQQVLSYGAGFTEIAFRLGATLVLSILYLAGGIIVFQRLQMQDSV
jgi:ABC-2 type transport system permease protein